MTATLNRDAAPNRDDKLQLLPFYLVCDVSASMADGNGISALNQAIRDIRAALVCEPMLADMAQFGLIDFSDDARLVIPLGNLAEKEVGPATLQVRGGTSFAAAFRKIQSVIEEDVLRLKGEYHVYRPTVFFLSDGEPNPRDDWRPAFQELTTHKYRPMIVPFGIGAANALTLAELIFPIDKSVLYMATNHSYADAIRQMTKAMMTSIIHSAQSVGVDPAPRVSLAKPSDLGPDVKVYNHALDELF